MLVLSLSKIATEGEAERGVENLKIIRHMTRTSWKLLERGIRPVE